MSLLQPQVYSAPFDAVAATYDETFTSSRIGLAQRAAVWNELAKAFCPGGRIVEIGCAQIDGNQRGLPVVNVKNIGHAEEF